MRYNSCGQGEERFMAATVWKGQLTFGLVSIPVRLYRAARAEKVSFRQLHRTARADEQEPEREAQAAEPVPIRPPQRDEIIAIHEVGREATHIAPSEPIVAPVRNTPTSVENAQPIPRSEIVKGYEYQPEQYVLVSDEELNRITPRTSSDIQILEFVHLREIDPVYFETSYYVAPDRAGEKPYALLYAALQKTGYVALAQIAMHRREHVAVIRAADRGILLHKMFYANEVRKDQEFQADPAVVASKELDLAVKLIEALATQFEPEKFKDKYREQVEALIAAKIQGREVASGRAEPTAAAPVADIMEALKKSLAAARKPPARAEAATAESKPEGRTSKRRVKR
jgi:DNA end-binding protein Ku